MALEPTPLVDEVTQLMDDISIFGGLNPEQVDTLLGLMESVSCPRGHIIFSQGAPPTAMYIILKGCVQLFFEINGKKLAKVNWGPGACIGMTAVLGIQAHAGTTMALEPCHLLRFTGEKLMGVFEEDKDLFSRVILNMARDASRRLHQTDQQIIEHMAANPEMLSLLLGDIVD